MSERNITVDGHMLNVAVGPDNGQPLVLLHGQASRWQDVRRALPTLVARHRVIAIDVPGHGASERLEPTEYTCATVSDLIAGAIDQLIDEPALLSGHSSGGVLALAITARHPELVGGLLLEDPPLFSSVPPRGDRTVGAVLHRIATEYLRERPHEDFQRFYLERSDYFEFFGPAAAWLTRWALRWIDRHPGWPLHVWFLPEAIDVWFEGMSGYDPAFGHAWVTGRWYEDFDTDSALRAVSVPTTLIHTRWWHDKHGTSYDTNGVLKAAMDVDDASRALSLLADGKLVTITGGHLVHFERSKDYLAALLELERRSR